jgi:GntR family transcriptional repressor for pyruvate dehydrogenase complex
VVGDRAFHQAIVEASHNSVLIGLVRQLAPGVAEIANASLARKGQPERSLATHRAIFEAIAMRDADQAGDLMAEHLLITGEIDLPARLTSDYDPTPAAEDEAAR